MQLRTVCDEGSVARLAFRHRVQLKGPRANHNLCARGDKRPNPVRCLCASHNILAFNWCAEGRAETVTETPIRRPVVVGSAAWSCQKVCTHGITGEQQPSDES